MSLVTNGKLRHEYEQHHRPGMYLGRHMELDARSLRYLAEPVPQIQPAEWLAPIPTLDQGKLGSCCGNAGTRHLAALVGADGLATVTLDGLTLGQDAVGDEAFAVEVYHLASLCDEIPGGYPPDDTGSSGLAVCQALAAKQLISSYVWAIDRRGFGALLQSAGCIIGMPWHEAFFTPDSSGFIDADGWADSDVSGGHEIYVEALEAWNDSDANGCIVRLHNSWTDSWGDHGCGRMRLSTYETLASEIDVKQFKR